MERISFTYTYDQEDTENNTRFSYDGEYELLDIWTITEAFASFLRGCGYVFKDIKVDTSDDIKVDTPNPFCD